MSNFAQRHNVKIGVFPSGSEVSIEVYRALRFIRNMDVIGLSSGEDYGQVAFTRNVSNLPFIHEPSFIDELKKVIYEEKIDFIVPGMDEVGFFLKSHEASLNCVVVYSSHSTSAILRRKSTTYKALQEHVSVPKIYALGSVNEEDFPLFMKPDIGYGSRGAAVVHSTVDLQGKLESANHQYILSEYLPGNELTIDCFSNLDSEILFAGPRLRNRVKMGISVSSKPIKITKEISDMATNISKALKLTGCWFFQIKEDISGSYKLLEVAARVAGSMALYRKLGVNFILLDLYQRMGIQISVPNLIPGNFKLERSLDARVVGNIEIDSVYVDLDDCILVKNEVNTELVAFLYACRNKGLPITLVTRHQGDLHSTLANYRLSGLFDEQFHLTNGESKHLVVTHTCPLFIDDSFEERKSMESIAMAISMSPDMVDIGMFIKKVP